jgi:hypothetical protein
MNDPSIDWSSVPAIALDAYKDKELTLDELKERYPAEVQP